MKRAREITREALAEFIANKRIPASIKIEARALSHAVDTLDNLDVYRAAYNRILEIMVDLPDEYFKITINE